MTDLVAAVVVTYNRRQKVTVVLDKILTQTRRVDLLVVVDNNSDDGTAEVLQAYGGDERVHLQRLPANTGGAGGFAEGISMAYELGADRIWLMDDDCYPEVNALERMIDGNDRAQSQLNRRVPFACSVVRWTNGEICEMNNAVPTWDWARLLCSSLDLVLVNGCSFVSVLLSRWAVTKHGLPLREYFIWFDDAEYTHRLSRAEGPGVQVLDSVVVHDLPTNRGVNYGDITDANVWKFEYGARNEGSYRFHREHPLTYLMFLRRAQQQMHEGRVPSRLRRRVLMSGMRGALFNPRPSYPRSVL